MFGGVGLYCDGLFFGLIDDDTLYMKVSDATRGEYEARGMKPFRPYADKPDVSMAYFTVPVDVLDDAEELVAWARRSVAIAAAGKKPAVRPGRPVARRRSAKQDPGRKARQ